MSDRPASAPRVDTTVASSLSDAFDRSAVLPPGVVLEQAGSTAWMAMFCLDLLEMALELANHDPAYQDVAIKFFEHFANIASAMNRGGLWDEADGFYYDLERRLLRLFLPDDTGRRPIWGSCALFQEDPPWRDELLFHEYFHGETGEGLGASHQTGWTALVAALVAERRCRVHPGRELP